jgi:uncharacterized protein YgiM (DUF1202 family)
MSISNGCSSIIIGDFGSSSSDSDWHGACYRRSLDTPVKNFKATFDIAFTSTGIQSDPYRPYVNNTDTVISGSKGTYYEVTAKSVNVRDKASVKKGKKIGTLAKGYDITSYTKVNSNWIKITYNGKTAYVSTKYLKKVTGDSTTTNKERNYVVVKGVNLRSKPSTKNSSVKLTLPAGTVIRCYTEKYGTSQGYLKLAKKYKGYTGYVFKEGYLIEASNYEVKYDYELDTADDKTGIIEVYGFANDNTQLFKVGMRDENEWYEHNIPEITYNTKTILTDNTTAPEPKEHVDYSESGADVDRLLSGTYGNWNDVEHCEFYVERIDGKVYASINKVEDGIIKKTISSSTYLDSSIVADKELSYIVLYIGTRADNIEKASDMALNYAVITNEDGVIEETVNTPQILANSEIVIDNSIPQVLVDNQEANHLVDIGSDFFDLTQGENTIKISSNATVNCDVIYNERYL